ncbi:hypothetical protein BDW74DRAFT_177899 [Aspergillus multicolor]|uniref:uncharacterized protein n=1 Tax=Aspergillus multicolor TaxID=41759 RepID=UPI003CCE0A0B
MKSSSTPFAMPMPSEYPAAPNASSGCQLLPEVNTINPSRSAAGSEEWNKVKTLEEAWDETRKTHSIKTWNRMQTINEGKYGEGERLKLWWATTQGTDGPEHWAPLVRPRDWAFCMRYEMEDGFPPETYTPWRWER